MVGFVDVVRVHLKVLYLIFSCLSLIESYLFIFYLFLAVSLFNIIETYFRNICHLGMR